MTKLSIKNKYYISAALMTLCTALLAELLYWLNASVSSNVNFTNTDNLFFKAIPVATNYLHILLSIAFIAASIGAVSYARAHFGPATSYKACLISLAAYILSEAGSYAYSVIYNTYNEAALKATLISVAVEILYIALLVFFTPVFTKMYLRLSLKNKSVLSRLRIGTSVIPAVSLYFLIRLTELSVYTVSATKSYISHGNTVSLALVISIILDVIYYIILHLAVPVALAMLTVYVLSKITGPLKLKIKGDSLKK